MSHFHYITPPNTPCPACHPASVGDHNITCAACGERSYTRCVNVKARTIRAPRTHHGSDAHGEKELQ